MTKEYVEVEKGIEEGTPTEKEKDLFETPKKVAKWIWNGLKKNVVPFALGTATGIALIASKGSSKNPDNGPIDVSYETPDNDDSFDEQ